MENKAISFWAHLLVAASAAGVLGVTWYASNQARHPKPSPAPIIAPGKNTLSERERQEVSRLTTLDPWSMLHYQQNIMPHPERLYEGVVSIRFTDPDVQPSKADKGWGNCALKCGFEPYQDATFTMLHYTGRQYEQHDKNIIAELKGKNIVPGDVTGNTTIFMLDGKRVTLTPEEQTGVDQGNEQTIDDLVKKLSKR